VCVAPREAGPGAAETGCGPSGIALPGGASPGGRSKIENEPRSARLKSSFMQPADRCCSDRSPYALDASPHVAGTWKIGACSKRCKSVLEMHLATPESRSRRCQVTLVDEQVWQVQRSILSPLRLRIALTQVLLVRSCRVPVSSPPIGRSSCGRRWSCSRRAGSGCEPR
jgi:hypothetical protein